MSKKRINIYTNMDKIINNDNFDAIVSNNVIKYIDLVNNKFVVDCNNDILIKENNDNKALKTEFSNESEIVIDLSNTEPELTIDLNKPEEEDKSELKYMHQEIKPNEKDDSEKFLDYPTIVAISPLFFEAINNYNKQSVLIGHIDSTVTKYIKTEKAKEVSLDEPIKTKIDEE